MKELIAFTRKRDFVVSFDLGWGNGYVAVPEGHPCFGLGYDDIHNRFEIDVNGGLTYSEGFDETWHPKETEGMWILGFDTAHYGDNFERWPDEASVLTEAERLKEQLINIV